MQAEAVAEFRQALALDPRLTPARFYLARVYMDLGLIERAREELIVILDQTPRQAQFMAVLAETERRLGRPARALEIAGDALSVDPAFTEARYYLGLALLDLGRRDEAIAELERVVASRPDSADAQLSLGAAYLDAGRIDPSIAALTRGLQLAPPKPDAFIYLARAYRLKGVPTRAQELLDRALPPGAVMQASAYYQQIETDLAVEQGLLHLDQKQFAAARRSLESAARLNPKHGPAQQHLATVYLRLGLAALAADAAAAAERLGTPVTATTRAAIDAALGRVPAGSSR
jgi:tetratricopeptide (TPR) repeat protein